MTYQYPSERQEIADSFFSLERWGANEMFLGKKVAFLSIEDKDMYVRIGTIYDMFYGSSGTTFAILSNGTHYRAKSVHIRKPAE